MRMLNAAFVILSMRKFAEAAEVGLKSIELPREQVHRQMIQQQKKLQELQSVQNWQRFEFRWSSSIDI